MTSRSIKQDVSRGCDFSVSRSRRLLDGTPLVVGKVIKSFLNAIPRSRCRDHYQKCENTLMFITIKVFTPNGIRAALISRIALGGIAYLHFAFCEALPWRYKPRVAFPFRQRSPARRRKRRGNPYTPPRCVPEEPAVVRRPDAIPPTCSPLRKEIKESLSRNPIFLSSGSGMQLSQKVHILQMHENAKRRANALVAFS